MTRPELPEQIPGQMTVDEVIAAMETEGPRQASQVQAKTKLTQEELQRQKTRREVQSRLARRAALKKAGADVATTNPDLAAKLEDGLKSIDRRVTSRGRTQDVVRKQMKGKR
jgi:Zn-dependent M32 family carboxypeptidase